MNFINSKPKIIQQIFWWIVAIGIPIPTLYILPYIMIHTFYPLALIATIIMIIIIGFAYYKLMEDSLKQLTKPIKKIFKFIIDTGN